MAVGIFTGKQHKPDSIEINTALSAAGELWNDLIEYISTKGKFKNEWIYYGKNYGWSIRYKRSGGALISLYPGDKMFTVQIVISTTLVEKLDKIKLHANTRKIVDGATLFHEGKWLFLKVRSRNDYNDVTKLIDLKCSPAK